MSDRVDIQKLENFARVIHDHGVTIFTESRVVFPIYSFAILVMLLWLYEIGNGNGYFNHSQRVIQPINITSHNGLKAASPPPNIQSRLICVLLLDIGETIGKTL